MHFIELPKFREKNPEESTKLEQWLWLLSGDREDKIKMAAEKNEEVKKTVDLLDELSMDEKERDLYFSRLIAMMDYNSGIDDAKTEGLKEGYDKAYAEYKVKMSKTIRELYKRKMSVEEIAQITGMSLDEVKDILSFEDKK